MAEPRNELQPGVEFRDELPRDAAIVAFARTRHGVVTTAELGAFGLSPAAVARRAAEASVVPPAPRGVLGRPPGPHAGRPPDGRGPRMRPGRRAVSSLFRCPARPVAGWPCDPRRDDPGRRGRPRRSIRVHSTTTLTAPDTTTVDAIPCTSVARTLIDLGDNEPPRLVERAIDQAEVLGVFDLAAIEDVLRAGRTSARPRCPEPRPRGPRRALAYRPRARGALPRPHARRRPSGPRRERLDHR